MSTIIGTGSYGCVVSPHLTSHITDIDNKVVLNADLPNDETQSTVSKIFPNEKEYMCELQSYEILKEIDPDYNFTMPVYYGEKIDVPIDIIQKNDYLRKMVSEGGYFHIVMMNGGTSLRQLEMKKFTMNYQVFLNLIAPIIEGVLLIHKAGYVHYDIKPGNLLYDGKRIALVDMGMMHNQNKVYVRENDILGATYPFYPPEHLLMKSLLNKRVSLENIDVCVDKVYRYYSTIDHIYKDEQTFKMQFSNFLNSLKEDISLQTGLGFNIDMYIETLKGIYQTQKSLDEYDQLEVPSYASGKLEDVNNGLIKTRSHIKSLIHEGKKIMPKMRHSLLAMEKVLFRENFYNRVNEALIETMKKYVESIDWYAFGITWSLLAKGLTSRNSAWQQYVQLLTFPDPRKRIDGKTLLKDLFTKK